jgi:hypothetical protein
MRQQRIGAIRMSRTRRLYLLPIWEASRFSHFGSKTTDDGRAAPEKIEPE